jgi:hypothetical protein
MGAYVNGRLYNAAAWLIVAAVSALSLLLVATTLFPGIAGR